MPNWVYNSGTFSPFTRNGKNIIQRLLEQKNKNNWFANALPVEVQVLIGDEVPDNPDEWLTRNSAFTDDFGTGLYSFGFHPSDSYYEYLQNKYGFVGTFFQLQTFDVKWGGCNATVSGTTKRLSFRFNTPWGIVENFYRYIANNGIEIKASTVGERGYEASSKISSDAYGFTIIYK